MLHLLTVVLHWVSLHHTQLLALVGGAGALSVFLESVLLKLKNKWHIDSKKLAFSLLHVLTLVTTVTTYYLSNIGNKDVLPVYGSLVIFAEFWHRFAVSPAYNRWVVPFLTWLSTQSKTYVAETTVSVAPAPSTTFES
jgi:hypothetical protein